MRLFMRPFLKLKLWKTQTFGMADGATRLQSLNHALGFRRLTVTVVVVLAYIVLWAILIAQHHSIPHPRPIQGAQVDIEEAYRDLQSLTRQPHPYNSHANDDVRNWLLLRIEEILGQNNVTFEIESLSDEGTGKINPAYTIARSTPSVYIFNDNESNITFGSSRPGAETVYFEGNNVIVYIVGSGDPAEPWWRSKEAAAPQANGVLVNAHFDSVSTGFGATDDGVGVTSLLQLLKHFTSPGRSPKRGIVLLANNGEEDYLNGAYAFTRHPLSTFVKDFVNLEGAGSGGKAALFRSTDVDITRAYAKSPHPFGNSLSADGFKRGLVRSQTDYVVFEGALDMHGLDVAFVQPRSRYHTPYDAAKYTSTASIYHMLSAALASTEAIARQPPSSSAKRDSVWFDLFGKGFPVFALHTLFAWTVVLLIIVPISLSALVYCLWRYRKMYLFASTGRSRHALLGLQMKLGGRKGFTRYPIAFIVSTGAVLVLALIFAHANPYIIYSSPYAVWTPLLTAWTVLMWFFLRGADSIRPSALQRSHALGWLTAILYFVSLGSVIAQDQYHITGTYPLVFFFLCSAVATATSYLEFIALPKISVAEAQRTAPEAGTRREPESSGTGNIGTNVPVRQTSSEVTPLLRRHTSTGTADQRTSTWSSLPHGEEQLWSSSMPTSLWLVQFLLLFLPIIPITELGLFVSSTLPQTLADGNSPLSLYMSFALISVLLIIPVSPFVHRLKSRLIAFLLCIFVGTFIYSLAAFPFSETNRLKVYFVQQMDLDSKLNYVSLTGVDGYVQSIIGQLPSAFGESIDCGVPALSTRAELTQCKWPGLAPVAVPSEIDARQWLSVTTETSCTSQGKATIRVSGKDTRACRLVFPEPIQDFNVTGASGGDKHFPKLPPGGTREIRLWSRGWNRTWEVEVGWEGSKGLDGQAICLWSDAHEEGLLPALDEVRKYSPPWAVVTKLGDGLLEGSKSFMISSCIKAQKFGMPRI